MSQSKQVKFRCESYKYLGKSIQRFTANGKDYCLVSDSVVSLPSEDNHVKRLLKKGKLKKIRNEKQK